MLEYRDLVLNLICLIKLKINLGMNETDFGKTKIIKTNNSTYMIMDSSFELYRTNLRTERALNGKNDLTNNQPMIDEVYSTGVFECT